MFKLLKLSLWTYQFTFLFLGLSISLPALKPTLAYTTSDPYGRITVTHTPNPVYDDSGEVTFTIQATEVELPTGYYQYEITIPGNRDCSGGIRFHNDNPNKIEVKVPIRKLAKCANIFGMRIFDLTYTPELGRTSGNSVIISGYFFDVQQPGGGEAPRVEALNQHLGISETPEVTIHNVKVGTTYSLWWDGSGGLNFKGVPLAGPIANHFTATNDGDSGKIAINKIGVAFEREETKTLCMAIGNYLFVYPGIWCEDKYKTTFIFSLFAPPPAAATSACSISPPNPTEIQSVSIQAKNLPENENFRADLIIKDTHFHLPTQNSGGSRLVSIPLANFLPQGDYTAEVYKASDDSFACGASFHVGPPNPATNPRSSVTQTLNITACGTPDNPGIATAIGCIHTNPVEFTKNILQFALGIGGGLSFLMMLLGAFQMLTSAGNPDALNAGRERLTSAIIGLLFVIFAVLLLQIIGFDILKIPGFGR